MARKHVSDIQVCESYKAWWDTRNTRPNQYLQQLTNDESRELGIELWNTRSNDQLQAELSSKASWIPVSERLPEKDGQYEVVVANDEDEGKHISFLIYRDKRWFFFGQTSPSHNWYLFSAQTPMAWKENSSLPDPPQTEIDITMYGKEYPDSHLACPGCGIDAGHDIETPPNPYYCDKCAKKLEQEEE